MYTGLVERNLFVENPSNDSDDASAELLVGVIVLIVLMGLAVIMRIYCRAYLLRNMGADDWTMIVAAFGALGLATCNLVMTTHYGLGRHQWTLPKEWGPPSRRIGYIAQIFYFAALGFCKASLILFVMRITSSLTTLRISWGLLIFCTSFTIAAVVVSICSCLPLEYGWNQGTPQASGMTGTCLDQRAVQYSLPAIGIFTDFLVWFLSLKMIWSVQLPPRQKASLIAIFALAGLGVLAGIFRLFSISQFLESDDRPWDGLDISTWSNVELNISIICGSAPAIKPFFSKFLPGLLGVSIIKSYTHPTSETYGRTGGNSKRSKFRSHPTAYALDTLNPATNRDENSSTEELGLGNSTKIEGRMIGGSVSVSEECLSENGGGNGHGGVGGGVKVTTDVQIHVEERV